MEYGDIGESIGAKNVSTTELISNDHADMMLDSWQGSTKESTANKVNNIRKYSSEISDDVTNFKSALLKLDEYKKNKKLINEKQTTVNNIHEKRDEEGKIVNQGDLDRRNSLSSEIQTLTKKNNDLKTEIQNIMNKIQDFNDEALKFFAKLPYVEDFGSLMELMQKFNSGKQVMNRNVSDEFVSRTGITVSKMHELISEVKSNYSGRDAMLMLTYNFMQMCADTGVRLNYCNNNGAVAVNPYIRTSNFLNGTDCCGSLSYLFNAALSDENGKNGFQWRGVSGFRSLGTEISKSNLSQMQAGDVFVNGTSHVALVIGVEPEKGIYYTLDSADEVVTRRFSDVTGEVTIRDMSSVYDGSQSTYRSAFEEYKGLSNYNENWLL